MRFTVLIVDDDPVFRTIASEILSPWFECIELESGSAALAHLAAFPVDLIVTDILMPDIDGLELIRSARLDGYRVPIIAVSGGGPGQKAEDLLEEAKAAGVDAVALKPLSPKAFLATVQRVLQEAQARARSD